jgi:hypothetical protein
MRFRRPGRAGALIGVLALSAGLAVHTSTAVAAATCTASVAATSSWSGGYQGAVTVANNGAALTPWTVVFTVPSGVTVQSGWNGDFSSSGSTVTVTAPSWSPTLAAGASVSLGFVANGPSSPLPSGVTLNGAACDGSGGSTPSPTPTTATPTPTVSTPPATCDSGAYVCDGFEGMAAGAPPTGTGHWSVLYPDCQGTGTAVVDTAVVHSGSASLRVDGTAGYCNHVFVQAAHRLDTGGPLFVRAWIRHSTPQPVSHTTMIAMTDLNDSGKDLRIGGQNSALQWNRSSDDATLPEQSPAGVAQSVPLPTSGWQCLEYRIDGTAGTAQTWLNGTSVVGLAADGVATADVDRQWYAKAWHPLVSTLKLGWESYGEGSDTLWYDDVVAGSSRIGC